MKPFLLLLAASALAAADPPKAPLTKYAILWMNSPFTSKPPPPEGPVEGPNPLEDYALGGISPITGGYRVTLLNRKAPDERITIDTGRKDQDHGFEVVSVDRKPGNPLGTVVHLTKGSNKGTVEFDTSLLTLKAPPAAPQQQQQQQGQAGGPPIPGQIPPGVQQAIRNRVVQPPVPTPTPGAAPPTFVRPPVPGAPPQSSGGRDGRENRRPERR